MVGILAWGNSAEIRISRLLLLQKRVMRIICNTCTSYRSHTDVLFRNNRILKINDLYLFHLGQFMYNLNENNIQYLLLSNECSKIIILYIIIQQGKRMGNA